MLSPGTLDPTFGNGGIVTMNPDGDNVLGAAASQPDGKIVFVGNGPIGDSEVVRLNADGSLDQTFGTGGIVRTPWSAGEYVHNTAIAIESDGDMVTAGEGNSPNGQFFAVARYLPDGELDPTFGTGGQFTMTLGTGDTAGGVAVDANGDIVVAGNAGVGNNTPQSAVLFRLTAAGAFDPTFGTNGVVTSVYGGGDSVLNAVAIQQDGRIVVAGETLSPGIDPTYEFVVARYGANGTLDSTFNGSGVVLDNFANAGSNLSGEEARAMAIGVNGDIVTGGYAETSNGPLAEFALARYNPTGGLDTTFNGTGHAVLDLGLNAQIYAVAVQSNGKVVVAGVAPYFSEGGFVLARYSANGVLDSSFGSDGVVSTQVGGGNDSNATSVAIQGDGNIVVGGTEGVGDSDSSYALARYIGDSVYLISATALPLSLTENVPFTETVASFTDTNPLATQNDYSVTITWGDGATSAGSVTANIDGGFNVTANHAYPFGTYQFSVSILDTNDNVSASASGTATVADAPLTASSVTLAGGDDGHTVGGLLATFVDGDPDAVPSDYTTSVNWGDGSTSAGTVVANDGGGFNLMGTHSYAVEGVYTVAIGIQDVDGATAGASDTITIIDPAPVATFVPLSGTVAAPLSGVLATFTDPDPDGNLSQYTATINWGDGTTTAGTLGTHNTNLTVSGTHTYAYQGNYTASVAIFDDGGADTSVSGTIAVADAPLYASAVSFKRAVDAPFAGIVATFTDADPLGHLSEYSATIAWGDGTTSAGTVATDSGGAFTVSGSHTYLHAGSYTFTVSILDVGGASTTASGTAIIEAALVLAAQNASAAPGASFTAMVATLSGGDPQSTAADYSATVNWGDGTTSSAGVAADPAGGLAIYASRIAPGPGALPFTVNVHDDEGGSASTDGTLNVAPLPENLAVSTRGPTQIFAVTNSGLLYRHIDATGWSFFGAGIFSIAAATEASGNVVLFAVTVNHAFFRLDSQSGWQMLGAPGTVFSVTAGTDRNGAADAFVITAAGDLAAFDSAIGWEMIGGRGSILAASAGGAGQVAVVTADHRIAQFSFQSGWQLLSGPGFANLVSAVTEASGTSVIVATNASGAASWYTSSSGWLPLGNAGAVQTQSAGTDSNGFVDLFAVAPSGALEAYTLSSGWMSLPQAGAGSTLDLVAGAEGSAVVVDSAGAVVETGAADPWVPITSAGFINN